MANDCIKAIRDAVPDLSEADAKDLFNRLENKAKLRAASKGITPEQAVAEVAQEMVARDKVEAAIDRRNRALHVARKQEKLALARQFKKLGDGVLAGLAGDAVDLPGAKFGAHQAWRGLIAENLSVFYKRLEAAGATHDFASGKHGLDVFRELENLGREGAESVTGNKAAFEIAKAYHGFLAEIVPALNRYGAWIRQAPDYIMHQTHDADLMRRAGRKIAGEESKSAAYKVWRESLRALNIDAEKTFEGQDPELWFRHFFDNVYSGEHGHPKTNNDPDAFQPAGSLARKISAERQLWFADADSAYKYSQQWGVKDYNAAMLGDIRNKTRQLAMMMHYGPNPEVAYNQIVRELRLEARDMDDAGAQMKALESPRIKGFYDLMAGYTEHTKSPTLTRWTNNIINWAVASKMGGVVLSSFGDKVFVANQLAHQGISAVDRFVHNLESMLPAGEERKRLLNAMGVVPHSFIGDTAARWGHESARGRGLERALKQGSEWTIKYGGFNWWNDTSTRAMAYGMAANLGEHAHLKLSDLPVEMQRDFRQYGIAEHWDAIRKTMWTSEEGHKFITPDRLTELGLPARDFDKMNATLRGYIADQTDEALNRPGVRERYVTTWGGTQRGTIAGELSRLVMLFKSFPITVVMKQYGRLVKEGGFEGVGDWILHAPFTAKRNVAMLIAMTGFAGYLSLTAKDWLLGKTRRPLFDEDGGINFRTWVASLQRGGGLGIYGDFLFSEYDRSYRSAIGALAGPVLGQVDPLASFLTAGRHAITGEDQDERSNTGAQLLQFGLNNTPFANLFYVKPVLDHYIFWHLKEMLSPGVFQRANRSIQEHNQQEYFVTPVDY